MATHSVKMEGFVFNPEDLTIAPGDTVIWKNEDGDIHTATSSPGAAFEFDTKIVAPSDEKTLTFDSVNSGDEAPYFCEVHTHMIGKIIVA